MGKVLFSFVSKQIAAATECVLHMLAMLKKNPVHFNNLLRINGSPYAVLSDNPSEQECTTAFLLTLYSWLEPSAFTIITRVIKPKGLAQRTKPRMLFCRLSWVCHCLMVVFSQKFPNLRKQFAIRNNGKPSTSNILDLMPLKPETLQQCISLLPFQSPRTFLACFGANKAGLFVIGDAASGAVKSNLPPVSKILIVMERAERFLAMVPKSKIKDSEIPVIIGDEEASEIASYLFGIHPCYWPLQSSNACGLPAFQNNFQAWKTCWENNVARGWDCANGAVRKLYQDLHKKGVTAHTKSVAKTGSPDEPGLDFVDEEPTDEQRCLARAKWLSNYNLENMLQKGQKVVGPINMVLSYLNPTSGPAPWLLLPSTGKKNGIEMEDPWIACYWQVNS